MNYKYLPFVPAALCVSMLLGACTMPDLYLPGFPAKNGNNIHITESTLPQKQSPVSNRNSSAESELLPGNSGVSVSITQYKEVYGAPDEQDRIIFEFSYAEPRVTVPGNESVSAEINERIAIGNELFYSGYGEMPGVTSACEYALDAYSYYSHSGTQPEACFYMTRTAKILRADSSVVSILFTDSSYFGLDEELKTYSGMCFSAADGASVDYYGLSADTEALNAIVAESLASDYKISVNEDETAKYFAGLSSSGLVMNIKGTLCTVNYEKLEDVISEGYLPSAYSGNAEINLTQLEPAKQYEKEISGIIVINADGSNYLLDISGIAKNISISSVAYTDDGFVEKGDIWFSDYIKDSLLQLKLIIPEGIPNIMLSYETENGTLIKQLFSQSGYDPKPMLVSSETGALG